MQPGAEPFPLGCFFRGKPGTYCSRPGLPPREHCPRPSAQRQAPGCSRGLQKGAQSHPKTHSGQHTNASASRFSAAFPGGGVPTMWPLRAAHTHRPPRNAGLVPHSPPHSLHGQVPGHLWVALRRLRFRCLPPRHCPAQRAGALALGQHPLTYVQRLPRVTVGTCLTSLSRHVLICDLGTTQSCPEGLGDSMCTHNRHSQPEGTPSQGRHRARGDTEPEGTPSQGGPLARGDS